jgi:hypothetical protein
MSPRAQIFSLAPPKEKVRVCARLANYTGLMLACAVIERQQSGAIVSAGTHRLECPLRTRLGLQGSSGSAMGKAPRLHMRRRIQRAALRHRWFYGRAGRVFVLVRVVSHAWLLLSIGLRRRAGILGQREAAHEAEGGTCNTSSFTSSLESTRFHPDQQVKENDVPIYRFKSEDQPKMSSVEPRSVLFCTFDKNARWR